MKNLQIFWRITMVLVLLAADSCQRRVADALFRGRPNKEFMKSFADASPEFRQGWDNGCEVGMAGGSASFYKMFYRNDAIDGYKMTSSTDYKTAWGNAFWYCYRYDAVKQQSTIWGTIFGGYK
jgi:hypothetical protein